MTILWQKMNNANLEPLDRYEACNALATAIEDFGAGLPCPHGLARERMIERTLEVANECVHGHLKQVANNDEVDYAGPGLWARPTHDVDEAATAIPFDLDAFGGELPASGGYIHVVETGEWMRTSGELSPDGLVLVERGVHDTKPAPIKALMWCRFGPLGPASTEPEPRELDEDTAYFLGELDGWAWRLVASEEGIAVQKQTGAGTEPDADVWTTIQREDLPASVLAAAKDAGFEL